MSERKAFVELPARLGGLALAVGALGVPMGAEAAVVTYTTGETLPASINFDPTTGLIGPGATLQFTINVATGGLGDTFRTAESDGSATAVTATVASNTLFATAVGDAIKFSSGQAVGPTSFTTNSAAAGMDTSFPPYLKLDAPYYIGFRVQVPMTNTAPVLTDTSPSYNYGYAEYETTAGTPILMYAFETQADTAITIPNPVPEPASLALLALGAAGVVGLRRRKAA